MNKERISRLVYHVVDMDWPLKKGWQLKGKMFRWVIEFIRRFIIAVVFAQSCQETITMPFIQLLLKNVAILLTSSDNILARTTPTFSFFSSSSSYYYYYYYSYSLSASLSFFLIVCNERWQLAAFPPKKPKQKRTVTGCPPANQIPSTWKTHLLNKKRKSRPVSTKRKTILKRLKNEREKKIGASTKKK